MEVRLRTFYPLCIHVIIHMGNMNNISPTISSDKKKKTLIAQQIYCQRGKNQVVVVITVGEHKVNSPYKLCVCSFVLERAPAEEGENEP